ncbi:MAG: hypothetical protein R3F11_32440 [Verrucomicrobiales bacterium]
MLWVRWVTEITHVEEGRSFVDEQRLQGPTSSGTIATPSAMTVPRHIVMDDLVHYALPFSARVGRPRRLRPGQLARVFAYRRQVLADRFGEREGEGEKG